ncbi:translation initiation factor IF-2 [Streptomyces sp. NPDC002248]
MTGPTDDDQRRSPETGATAHEEDRLRHAFALIAAECGDAEAGSGTGVGSRAEAGFGADVDSRAEAGFGADVDSGAEVGFGANVDSRAEAGSRADAAARPIPPRLLRPPRFSRPGWRRARAIGSGLVALAACVTLFTVVARTGGGDADSADGAASRADGGAAAKTVRRCDAYRTVVRGELTAARALPDGRVRVTVRVSDWLRPPSGEPTARFDVPAPAGDAYRAGQRVLVEVPRQEDAPPRVTTGRGDTERRLRVLGCG